MGWNGHRPGAWSPPQDSGCFDVVAVALHWEQPSEASALEGFAQLLLLCPHVRTLGRTLWVHEDGYHAAAAGPDNPWLLVFERRNRCSRSLHILPLFPEGGSSKATGALVLVTGTHSSSPGSIFKSRHALIYKDIAERFLGEIR